MNDKFDFNYEEYVELLKAVASLSRLFSDNQSAYIDPNFVERLFIHTSNGNDLSKKYNSFDAHIPLKKIGIGIKTFGIPNINSIKKEKVAELTKYAGKGYFNHLTQEQIAIKVAQIRNDRIKADVSEYDIEIANSYYHCLLRVPGGAIIHQEPYSYIDIANIHPIDPTKFKPISKFPSGVGSPIFSDGKNIYSYSISKNVLYKRFDASTGINSEIISLSIYDDVFKKVLQWFKQSNKNFIAPRSVKSAQKIILPKKVYLIPGKDYVILPLYSTRNLKKKKVGEKSGINQWNAAGRKRKFGEAYIPVPALIHEKFPNFFPKSETVFNLKLPNGKIEIAKICQEGGKALMTNPNDVLCTWLYKVIDPKASESELQKRLQNKIPFTYQDLERIGKDSVRVKKIDSTNYAIEFTPIDSYDLFIEGKELLEEDE
jgi:hypothetical protein